MVLARHDGTRWANLRGTCSPQSGETLHLACRPAVEPITGPGRLVEPHVNDVQSPGPRPHERYDVGGLDIGPAQAAMVVRHSNDHSTVQSIGAVLRHIRMLRGSNRVAARHIPAQA